MIDYVAIYKSLVNREKFNKSYAPWDLFLKNPRSFDGFFITDLELLKLDSHLQKEIKDYHYFSFRVESDRRSYYLKKQGWEKFRREEKEYRTIYQN
jgi:PHP family Zn ribbon phosphoesterase